MSGEQTPATDPPPDPRGRDQFTERRAHSTGEGGASDREAAMRREYQRDREDLNRKSIDNVRNESRILRAELRADIEKVSDASRERDRELHQKLDQRTDKFDERLDGLKADLLELRGEFKGLKRAVEKPDEFADAPWYARPSYIKAMGLAFAAVIAAVLTSLGLIFGWGTSERPPHPPPSGVHAPADPHAPEDPADDAHGD